LLELRGHRWTPAERAVLISLVAIAMGSLFVTTYSLTLGDPIPRHINAAIIGDGGAHSGTIDSTERVAGGKLDFHPYSSLPAALHAIDVQHVYAALDVASPRPTLYVASAAGASVARVLERIATVDPGVRVRDTHPLSVHDPNGLNLFYLMLVTTIVGFLTVFQVLANAGQLPWRHQIAFVLGLALTASLVLTLVDGPLLSRLTLPVPETWGILALQLLVSASFTSLMVVLIGRWAILPTWLFVVVLGNASSGGAVSSRCSRQRSRSSPSGIPPARPSRHCATRSTSLTTSKRGRSSCSRPGRSCCSPRGSGCHAGVKSGRRELLRSPFPGRWLRLRAPGRRPANHLDQVMRSRLTDRNAASALRRVRRTSHPPRREQA
jgi:hypothetical protein